MLKKTLMLWNDRIGLPLILLAGFILRVYNLSAHSFFSDEVFVVNAVKAHASALFVCDAPHGPLYLYVMFFWTKLFGSNEFWTRFPSVLFGVATIYLVYVLTLELFGKKPALTAAFLTSFSPFLILYNRTGRWYSLFVMLGVMSVYFTAKYIRTNKSFDLFLGFLSALFLLYCEAMGVFIIAVQWAAVLPAFKKIGIKWILSQIALFVLIIPAAVVFVTRMYLITPANMADRGVGGGLMFRAGYAFFSFSLGQTVSPFYLPVIIPFLIFFMAVFAAGVISFYKVNRTAGIFLGIYLSLLSLKIFLNISAPHYLMDACIPYFIILSLGLSSIRDKRLFAFALMLVLFIFSYSLYNLYSDRQYNRMELVDEWKQISSYVENISDKGTLVLHSESSRFCSDSPIYYYAIKKPQYQKISEDAKNQKKNITEHMKKDKKNKTILVSRPLSGLFRKEMEQNAGLKKWLDKKYVLISVKGFSRDREAYLKRRYVNRSFPEYRIIVYEYGSR